MILVTVGAQMPFDRMIEAVDAWAGETGRDDVFAQIAEGRYRPRNMPFTSFLDPSEYQQRLEAASVLVAHAGMGSILSALEHRKPILVMPRREALQETRNDHQVATAKAFRERGLVTAALDAEDLREKLDGIDDLVARPPIAEAASGPLIDTLRDFIRQART